MVFDYTVNITAVIAAVTAIVSVAWNWATMKAAQIRQDEKHNALEHRTIDLEQRNLIIERMIPRLEERITQIQGSMSRIEGAVMALLQK